MSNLRVKIIFCISLFWLSHASSDTLTSRNKPLLTVDQRQIEFFEKFNGLKIKSLSFFGLKSTKEKAIRWLMKTTEGEVFSSSQLAADVQAIYNTGILYDIKPYVEKSESDPTQVEVTITLKDKWTLLPVAGGKGGGGSLTYGAGLYDSNLFGYFTRALFFGYNYNNTFSYFLSLKQDKFANTDFMGRFEASDTIEPTYLKMINGNTAGDFTWRRKEIEVMGGIYLFRRDEIPIQIKLNCSEFEDFMISKNGVNAFVYDNSQYQLNPQLIIGRVDQSDFLEKGTDLKIKLASANFFDSRNYNSASASFRQLFTGKHQNNYGYHLFASSMTKNAPPPYQFDVGGYESVRGFITSRQVGPNSAYANFEIRPYIFSTRVELFDLDLMVVQGNIFTDAGSAWGDSTLTGEAEALNPTLLVSVGIGLRFHFVKFAEAIIRIDVAKAVTPNEGGDISFGAGQFF